MMNANKQKLRVNGVKSQMNTVTPSRRRIRQNLIDDNRVINRYVARIDTPVWFRGLSQFQLNAINELLNALRDDSEQETTHRVRRVLVGLGLMPMITSRQIAKLMELSRGNDLAFLWFLMQLHYKSTGPGYHLNEQLIMMAIYHLDFTPTVKELDRILPPAHPSMTVIKSRKQSAELKRRKYERSKLGKKKLSDYVMPYFAPLVRPQKYGKPLVIQQPDFKVDFTHRERQPGFGAKNESSRWFADYQLNPSKRITKLIIKDEIENLFREESMGEDGAIVLPKESRGCLCHHHKTLEDLENSLRLQLEVVARDRCIELFDHSKQQKEESYKRVITQLKRDIQDYMKKFQQLTHSSNSCSNILCTKSNCNFQTMQRNVAQSKTQVPYKNNDQAIATCHRHQNQQYELDKNNVKLKYYFMDGIGDCNPDLKQTVGTKSCPAIGDGQFSDKKALHPPIWRKKLVPCCKAMTTYRKKIYLKPAQINSSSLSTPTSSDRFFIRPQHHTPYFFEYHKIFKINNNDTMDDMYMKRAILYSLAGESAKRCKNLDVEENIDAAINKYITDLIKNYNDVIEKENKTTYLSNYKETYYDPRDEILMEKMLSEAMTHIRNNPKFVLASMPDAHKLPMLKEFIRQRFGKAYSKQERMQDFHRANQVFLVLQKQKHRVHFPTRQDLGTDRLVSYNCHDYLEKRSKFLIRKYKNSLNNCILQQARVLWLVMRPTMCTVSPRKTFFSYMPARTADLTTFRPWKYYEYRDHENARKWERLYNTDKY